MSIATSCPHCHATGSLPDEAAGRKVKCPACNQSFTVSKPQSLPVQRLPSLPATNRRSVAVDVEAVRECPFCREPVADSARKCKHCGETIDLALRAAEEERRVAEVASRRQGNQVVNVTTNVRQPFNHGLHLLLTLLTCGLWAPIWLICWIAH